MYLHGLWGESLTVTLTFQDLLDQLDLTEDEDITAIQAEKIMDQATNKIVLYGKGQVDIPNMTGTAGSKTLSLDQAAAGAVLAVAVAIYKQDYKQSGTSESTSLGPASTSSSLQTAPSADNLAKDMAEYLRDLDVSVG